MTKLAFQKAFPIFFAALFAVVAGCALPVPEKQTQDFVSEREITVVSLTREGLDYARRSRLVDAELKLRQAHFLAPDEFGITLNLAVVLDRQGLYEEAISLYRSLRDEKPRSIQVIAALAHVYANKYEFGEAERLYLEALEIALDENLPAEILQLSQSLSALNFLRGDEEAARCWSAFALSRSSGPDQLYRHARLLLAADKAEEVFALFKENNVNPSSDPRLELLVAQAHIEKGEDEQALALVKVLLLRNTLPVNMSFELDLLKTLVFQEAEQVHPDQMEEYEKKKEELFSILDTDPGESQVSIYWPGKLTDRLQELYQQREELRLEQGKSLLWYSPPQ